MNREVISDNQGVCLIILFIVAETFVLTRAMEAKQDFWLAIIFAMLISIPFMLIFYRIHSLDTNKDILDINEYIFGRILGKILNFLLVYYVATNMMSVMYVFNDFIITASLRNTPKEITYISLTILSIWVAKGGIEVMGRWTEYILPIIIIVLFIGSILLIPQMEINNMKPILSAGIKPIIEGGILTFLFPLSETIAFTMIFSGLKSKKSYKKIYLKGLIYGGLFIILLVLTEVLVLGVKDTLIFYFPGYRTFSRLNPRGVMQRLEIISAATFILGGFIKISVLLLAVSRGTAKIFGFHDYRFIVTPVALIIANISYIFYDNTIHMFEWISDFWGYFAFPFEFCIPIIIWIMVEIKNRRLSKNQSTT